MSDYVLDSPASPGSASVPDPGTGGVSAGDTFTVPCPPGTAWAVWVDNPQGSAVTSSSDVPDAAGNPQLVLVLNGASGSGTMAWALTSDNIPAPPPGTIPPGAQTMTINIRGAPLIPVGGAYGAGVQNTNLSKTGLTIPVAPSKGLSTGAKIAIGVSVLAVAGVGTAAVVTQGGASSLGREAREGLRRARRRR